MQMPLTLARKKYCEDICAITNNSGLPAFVVADILERILAQTREKEKLEYKRDEIAWHKANSNIGGDDDSGGKVS